MADDAPDGMWTGASTYDDGADSVTLADLFAAYIELRTSKPPSIEIWLTEFAPEMVEGGKQAVLMLPATAANGALYSLSGATHIVYMRPDTLRQLTEEGADLAGIPIFTFGAEE